MLMKQALTIGVYDNNLIYQSSPYPGDNVFAKGLEANGYEVTRFDYRATIDPNNDLIKIAEKTKPNLFWFGKAERINPNTIRILKSQFPNAIFVKWFADIRNQPTIHDMSHNAYMDWCFGTAGGNYLLSHLLPQMKGVASIITFTDSDYYKMIDVDEKYKSDILWTGRSSMGNNLMRDKVINFLNVISNANVKIAGIRDWLGDPEYLYYINGTKIGIGVNSFNRVKYTSDRLGNYISCGTFYLPHYFEGIEEIFTRKENLDWYKNIEELQEKIEYYLSNPEEREKIAEKSKQFVIEHFDYEPLTKNLLNIIVSGKSNYSFDDVFLN